MATLSHSESRRLYSWWWDSHISPKNSRWLQENLTDMDGKVKSMIKLIEEDADSFARRAEMYYKKRPELMKLVEEFYRAYRALAEKYNHTAGELHYAKCAIEDAFPDQEPFELAEDSTPKSLSPEREPHTPKINLHARALFNADDLSENAWGRSASDARANNQTREGRGRKDLKQEKDKVGSLRDEMIQLSHENQNLKDKVSVEIERVGKAESEAQDLNIALGKAQLEKDALFIQYLQCLKKLSELEAVLDIAQKDSMRLDEKSSMAEIEILTLKESLVEMESEKISALVKHTKCLERISNLEAMITLVQEDRNGLDERVIKAEGEAQSLKDELSRLILENEAILVQYKQSLAKLSDLENIISAKEDNAKLVKMQAKRADTELAELKKILAELSKDKEASALQYKFCLETINKLQKDLMAADENVKQLENKVMIGAEKLKTAEQKCKLLDFSNQSLRVEADNLSKKIALKDQELSDKQVELENLQARLQDEHLRYSQIETSLDNLQNLNSQSQDDRRALELDFKYMLQMLKDLEVCKNGLEVEIQQVRDDNHSLSQTNLSSTVKMENMQNEIGSLQKMKQWLEQEVSMQMDLSKSLQQQINSLTQEISDLNSSYESLIEQVKAAGLDPECIGASLKSLEDENTRLKNACDEISNEKEFVSKKLECIEELLIKPSIRESFLMDLNGKLEGSSEQRKTLAESCRCLEKENTELAAEKAYIFSQLQAVTENMHRLLEKNAVLENSLSTAKVELEGLREKSKGLEEICGLLKNERSYLLTERCNLALKLEDVEKKLKCLENRFVELEEERSGFEKEKKDMHFQVEELKQSLVQENQELICAKLRSETKFAGLEKHVHLLHQENLSKKNNLEEEVDRALKSQFEISILKTFMKDMEEKNYSLIIECQKHVEASKRAERVISELESENLEQQVETELLLDEIERLRLEIYQVFRALETGPDYVISEKIENEKNFVHHILRSIEGMKLSIIKFEEDKQQLLVENSILLTVLEQLDSEGTEIQSQKMCFEHEFNTMARNLAVVKNEKDKILEMNRQLKSDVNDVHHHAAKLGVELENVCVKQADLRKSYCTLQEALAEANQENKSLVKKYSNLEEEKGDADEQNDAALLELLSTANSSTVLCEFGMEKALELKLALTDLNKQQEVTNSLEKQLSVLREQLRSQKTENFLLTDAVRKLEKKMKGVKEHNVCMKDLESEPSLFRNGIEEKIIAEDEKNAFELWESEAEAFFFDLQISSIHEVMFQDKVHELTGVCKTLEDERASKMLENELLNEKIYSMAREIVELKSELNAYSPIIGALRDDIAFLEHHMILQTKLKAARNESKFLDGASNPRRSMSKKVIEDQSLLSLQKLQTRMNAVRKLMEGMNNPLRLGRSNPNSNEEPPMNESKELQSRRLLGRDRHGMSRKKRQKLRGAPKLQKIKNKATEVWNGMLMKDITLDQLPSVSLHGFTSSGNAGIDDQMFEFWESSKAVKGDQTLGSSPMMSQKMMRMGIVLLDNFDNARHKMDSSSTHSDMLELSTQSSAFSVALDNEKIHERLASNVRKLEILQTTVENLRARLLMTQDSSKSKNIDFGTVFEQLLEAEETVEHLGDMNVQIVKNIEWSYGESEVESPSEAQKMRKMKAMEQARKVSERVDRLQLELQKIQYILLKFEDESKNSGRNKFFRSKTIILRDFIYNGRKNSGKRKKSPLCGCLKPPTSRNERSL